MHHDVSAGDAARLATLRRIAALLPLLQGLARRGVVRRFAKGVLLIREGERDDTIYIVLEGRVRVRAEGERGRELTYGIYGPGEYLGELSLDGGPRSADVVTLEACECAIVTRQSVLGHIAEHPEFALELLSNVIRRVRSVTSSARQFALNDVYGRLLHLIQTTAKPHPQANAGGPLLTIEERLTHRELANRLGCSREMVTRLLKDLEGGDYLRLDPERLLVLRTLPSRW